LPRGHEPPLEIDICLEDDMSTMPASWNLKGTVFIACNCDYGCPCNFNAPPTHGNCTGGWTWHVEKGSLGDVKLDGLNFSVFAAWPKAIHLGNGEALIYIDESADQKQRDAIATLVKGDSGGPWGILAWTWPKHHGTKFVKYEIAGSGIQSKVKAGSCFELELTPIKNPVSGAEVHPSMVLPEGLIVKQGELAASRVFKLDDAIQMDYPDRYTAVGPFEYSGLSPAPPK
jgi:hypothetical protein